MKNKLKNIKIFKYPAIFIRTFYIKPGFFNRLKALRVYFKDLRKFKKLDKNREYRLATSDLFPRIYDKTITTNLAPIYYLQGCWCARKIFDNKPARHYDIASQVLMVG